MWDSINNEDCEACKCSARSKRSEDSFLDKENVPQLLSPMKSEELSFYGSSSPPVALCAGTSPNHCSHNIITRRPLEDYDPNSRDSGYIPNNGENGKFSSYASPSRGFSRLSFESGCSMDDDFFEDFSDLEPLEDNLPRDFGKLISGPIRPRGQDKNQVASPRDLALRPLFRRALSLQNENSTPTNSRVRSCLFKPTNELRAFKRPEPPLEFTSPTNAKKAKFEEEEIAAVPRPVLRRAVSSTEESIMWAVQKSSTEPDLIGDFSKTFCLPLTPGRHQDLKSITPATLAQLIKGKFNDDIASFKVIDCRYPYEFDGGHISGAVNLYTKEQCMDLLTSYSPVDESQKRTDILVFHCEFSSERGPNLCRYLRKEDRHLNQDTYPSLNFPEIYLLEGGYKNFFQQFADLCDPVAYKEMLHPEHESDLRHFRLKSKTWNVDSRQRPQFRGTLKKLGFK